ncbi:TonB family protein [Hyalangium minutum]|uniref:non-specific serine/threonine protein kinase n=1 Tax=Hyalangium minutum TaxID=394096 RepID=A0A085WAG8_9BACT|nr:TonB family protein [Hyalangium minutum]KFE64681.1 Serine/threonine protein kinase PrkC, regulator of stationary phase [Hyalangium minutum]
MIKSDAPSTEAVATPGGDPLVGRTLNGRFSITEPIGIGGMGKVYKAMQAPLDRVVALKVLNPSFPSTKDPGFQQRFLREASLTSKLRHPNTVTVIDYGQSEDGIYYIAMEYLEGRTLAQALAQSGSLPWSRVIAIVQQVCRSLREAHGIGIVHRDLKPANIMLLNESDQDLVKVLDFGLVKYIAENEAQAALNPEITQSGTFLGSPQYMAPEQARNVSDARSDIYSLGVVMYQMLQGRPPFIARDHLELIFAHCKEPPPPFNSLRPHHPVPADIEHVVMRCLEKDPARRYQSMDEMLEALRTANMAAGGHSGIFKRPGAGATTGPHPSPAFASAAATDTSSSTLALDISVEEPESAAKGRKRKTLALALAGGAIVLGLGTTFAVMRPKEAPPAAPVVAEATPAAAPAPSTPPPAAPEPTQAAPQKVRFRLMSEPTGARVYYQGKERGTTPFVLELPAGGDGTVTAELVFALEGYQTEAVITGGSGDVVLSQKLQRRRGGLPGSRTEFASARGSSLEPATSMASLHPAESLAPSAPVAKAADSDNAPTETSGSGGAVQVLPANVLAAAGAKPMPYGDGMSRPEQLEGKEITYTREALAARVQGTMLVKCTITREGRVQSCRVLKSVPLMEQTVVAALLSRVYKPILYKGQVVAVDYVFNIKLQMPRR